MADEKFTVYTDQGDGKPQAAATFSDEADAREYAQRKGRFGSRTYVASGTASKEVLKRRFPRPARTQPANRAMDARLSSARAQVLDEAVTEEARAQASDAGSGAVKTMRSAQPEQKKASEPEKTPTENTGK